jgi:hypothetical protein
MLSKRVKGKSNQAETQGARLGRPRIDTTSVDKDWFVKRLREVGLTSQADLARGIESSRVLLTRSLKGDRPFTAKEVASLAAILRTSSDEVLRHIGMPIPPRGALVSGKITGEGKVSTVVARKGALFPYAEAPGGAEALIAETEGTPLASYHGATFVYLPATEDQPVPPAAMGSWCVVEVDDHLTPFIGALRKGPHRQAMVLEIFGTNQKMEVRAVHRMSPILSIHFP